MLILIIRSLYHSCYESVENSNYHLLVSILLWKCRDPPGLVISLGAISLKKSIHPSEVPISFRQPSTRRRHDPKTLRQNVWASLGCTSARSKQTTLQSCTVLQETWLSQLTWTWFFLLSHFALPAIPPPDSRSLVGICQLISSWSWSGGRRRWLAFSANCRRLEQRTLTHRDLQGEVKLVC